MATTLERCGVGQDLLHRIIEEHLDDFLARVQDDGPGRTAPTSCSSRPWTCWPGSRPWSLGRARTVSLRAVQQHGVLGARSDWRQVVVPPPPQKVSWGTLTKEGAGGCRPNSGPVSLERPQTRGVGAMDAKRAFRTRTGGQEGMRTSPGRTPPAASPRLRREAPSGSWSRWRNVAFAAILRTPY